MIHRPALLILLLAGNASAQDCRWRQIATGMDNSTGGSLVYDAARSTAVFVSSTDAELAVVYSYEWPSGAPAAVWRPGMYPYRFFHAAAYDLARARTVLYGGYHAVESDPNEYALGDTWEWNGATWIQRTVSGPGPRYGHSMVYDAARAKVILFGGGSSNLWEWDGTTWTDRTSPGPSSRADAALVYDSDRAKTVLMGGINNNVFYSDIWEWDGSAWTLRAATGFPGGTAAYDTVHHRVITVGGPNIIGAYFAQTWSWDSSGTWTLLAGGPDGYLVSPIIFDPISARILAVARRAGTAEAADLWAFDAAATGIPPAIAQQPPDLTAIPGIPATLHVSVLATSPTFQWFKNTAPLSNSGNISGAQSDTLTIDPVTGLDSGSYSVTISNACGAIHSRAAIVFVTEPPPSPCYANCDNSTLAPILNVNDFQCFINALSAHQPYANCDHSTANPILNVNDFQCFLNSFAAGCT